MAAQAGICVLATKYLDSVDAAHMFHGFHSERP
ncbi:hypothetical protein FHS51_000688 [Sphingobium wenxiniae]|nr:hypothetical protein [Sphingobium wenxiniae]